MQVINKEEFLNSKRKYLKKMKDSLFIYPTDSIYGLGCDATNEVLVDRIRKLKKNNLQAFSVIAPSKVWVEENCVINKEEKKYFDLLGSKMFVNNKEHCFTLILKLKNKKAVAQNVLQGSDTIGIIIPSNWFSNIVNEFGLPLVTTSANSTGENFMTSIEDLSDSIRKGVDFIVYEGEKKSIPSTIINFVKKEVLSKKRAK